MKPCLDTGMGTKAQVRLFNTVKSLRKPANGSRRHDIEPVVDQELANALEAVVNHPGRLAP